MTKLNVEEGKRFDVLGAKADRTPAEEKEYNELNVRNTENGRSDRVNTEDGRHTHKQS